MAKKIDNSDKYKFFWSTSSEFSNWYPATYTFDNIEFCCSEQGVMWSKAKLFKDDETTDKILKCTKNQQKRMKDLGRQVKNFDETIWNKEKVNIYTKHCREKFSQNQDLKNSLLSTHPKILVEASPYDSIWGIGLNEAIAKKTNPNDWPGKNLLGILLTNLRDELAK